MQSTTSVPVHKESHYLALAIACFVTVIGAIWLIVFAKLSVLDAFSWMIMTACITWPLWFDSTLRQQAFHACSYSAFEGVRSFAIPGLLVWILGGVSTPFEQFSQGTALIGASYLLYWLGWRSNLGMRLAGLIPLIGFPNSGDAKPQHRVWGMAIVLYIAGWMGRYLRARTGFSHLPTELGSGWQLVGLFSDLNTFAQLGYVLILYMLLRRYGGRLPLWGMALSGLLLVLEIVGGAIEGGRSNIVVPLLYTAMVYHFAVRPIQWRTLIVAFVVALVVIAPVLTLYRTSFFVLLQGGERPGLQTTVQAIGQTGTNLFSGLYQLDTVAVGTVHDTMGTFDGTLRVLDRVPSRYDFEWGGTFVADLLISFIPRIFWPDKPLYLTGRTFAIHFWDVDDSTILGDSRGIGMPAEAYYNFGWLGLLMFPLLGIGLRFLWERYRAYERTESTYIVRAFFILLLMAHLSNTFVGYFSGAVRIGLTYMVFMALVNCQLPKRIRVESRDANEHVSSLSRA